MKTAAGPTLRYVRAISARMFAPYSDLRMGHASSTKMNFPCAPRVGEGLGDRGREDPELLRVEAEALVAAGGHLGEHVSDEHLVMGVAGAEAGVEGDDGVRVHREVLSADKLREPPVTVALVEHDDVGAERELLEDHVDRREALPRAGDARDGDVHADRGVERIEEDRRARAPEEDLHGRPRARIPAVEREEVGEVLAQEGPRAAAVGLEVRVVPEGQTLDPRHQGDRTLDARPALELREAREQLLGAALDPVGTLEEDEVERRAAEAQSGRERLVREGAEFLVDAGRPPPLVAQQPEALAEREEALAVDPGPCGLRVEDRAG